MPLGIPVPDNVQEMPLDDLYKLHATYWSEHDQIKAKRAALKPHIDRAEMAKQIATRAGYDKVLAMPQSGKKLTLAKAKQLLQDAQEGFIGLATNFKERLARIVSSGKDEE